MSPRQRKLKEVADGIGIQEMPHTHREEGLGRRIAPGGSIYGKQPGIGKKNMRHRNTPKKTT